MVRRLSLFLSVCAMIFSGGCATYYAWTSGYHPDENYTVKTSDDWTLALYRYKPRGARVKKIPVILCHGLGMNAVLWDLREQNSFARYLSTQGFDVWTVDLRGAGRSTKPGWVVLHDLMSGPDIGTVPTSLASCAVRFGNNNWDMDDYITKDVPAILKEVKRVTGAPKVHWIGHSMGGMICYAYLIRNGDESIQDLVAMATPMSMPRPHSDQLNFLEKGSDFKDFACLINSRLASRSFGLFGSIGSTPMDPVLFNRENVENEVVSRLLINAMEDISPGVLEGFITMIKSGEFVSPGKPALNYTRTLSRVRVPLLLVGGWSDPFCSVVSIYDTYRSVGSTDKTLRIFGRLNGYRMDYGHNDLIIGKHAPQDVYPFIADWLEQRS